MNILDKMHKEVLERIIELKDKRNLSDKEFGVQSGMGEKAIDNWKRGNSASFMKRLDEIAKFFDVTTEYLLGNEQKNKPAAKSDELSPQDRKIIDLIQSLSPEKKRIALAQLEAMSKLPNNE